MYINKSKTIDYYIPPPQYWWPFNSSTLGINTSIYTKGSNNWENVPDDTINNENGLMVEAGSSISVNSNSTVKNVKGLSNLYSFTISFWTRIQTWDPHQIFFNIGQGFQGNLNRFCLYCNANNNLVSDFCGSSFIPVLIGKYNEIYFPNNKWVNITLVKNRSSEIYILYNGILNDCLTRKGSYSDINWSQIEIASSVVPGQTIYYKDMRVWNYCMSLLEINHLYQNGVQ